MDRNLTLTVRNVPIDSSLSARRAWIEMLHGPVKICQVDVASLSARRAWIEIPDQRGRSPFVASLSARRAWIEILISARQVCLICVALRKESVDRNCDLEPIRNAEAGRSPQGERG